MDAPLLQMRGIVKTYPGTVACDGADLEVQAGEVHCLLGENGAGKSTLMKILAGSVQPDAGQILLDGVPLRLASPHDGIKAGISVIYQELDLSPDLTVAQNLYLGHAPSRAGIIRRATRHRLAGEMIERVGGTFSPSALVRTLSVADQQLTAIAKALTMDAKVLVMDEPSAALTEQDLPAVFELIRRVTREGHAVIYISHRLDEVKEIGDRATVMRDGRTVARFQVSTTSIDELVTAMIGHRPDARVRPPRSFPAGTPALDVGQVEIPGVLDVRGVTVQPGQIVGLAGLGGAGRSTLLAGIFGARPAATDVRVHGQRVRSGRPSTAVRAGLGLVPEDRKTQGLLRELSVLRNASLAALRPRGLRPSRAAEGMTRKPLQDLGVRYASSRQPAGQLSGGNQQKVVLSKWLTRGSTVLLLDEPTRGIDVGAKEELFRHIHRLADQGVGVLMASSELSELTAHADSIWVLHEGRNVAQFDPRVTPESAIAHCVVTGKVHGS